MCARSSGPIQSSSNKPRISQGVPTFTLSIAKPCSNTLSHVLLYRGQFVQLTNVFQMSFLPSPSIRKIITIPTEDKTDFRAACFCHKHIVDVGYVCSVCLSSLARSIPLPTYHH